MPKRSPYESKAEYAALRQFVRTIGTAEGGGVASGMRSAVESELTGRQRQLVEMYYLRQMRMQDIADELGLDISTVSRTLKRAKARLRRCLKYGGSALLNAIED